MTESGCADSLLEHILLVAEISELKANADRPAEGTIVEGNYIGTTPDGMSREPQIGPLVSDDHRRNVAAYVEGARRRGRSELTQRWSLSDHSRLAVYRSQRQVRQVAIRLTRYAGE